MSILKLFTAIMCCAGVKMRCKMHKYRCVVIDHVHNMWQGDVFTCVCVTLFGGGGVESVHRVTCGRTRQEG